MLGVVVVFRGFVMGGEEDSDVISHARVKTKKVADEAQQSDFPHDSQSFTSKEYYFLPMIRPYCFTTNLYTGSLVGSPRRVSFAIPPQKRFLLPVTPPSCPATAGKPAG